MHRVPAVHARSVKVDGAPYSDSQTWKYVWLDVTSDEQVLPPLAPDLVVIKAVPLFDTQVPDPAAFPLDPQQHLDWMVSCACS